MPTFLEIADELITEAGELVSNAGVSEQFVRWVIEAYNLVTTSGRYSWHNRVYIIVTSANQSKYALDPDITEIRIIRNRITGKEIGYNTIEELTRSGVDMLATGTARYWYYADTLLNPFRLQVQLVPTPTPDQQLEVHALAPLRSVAANSSIPLPEEFLIALRYYVRSQYYMFDGKTDEAQTASNTFQGLLSSFASRYTVPTQGTSVIGSSELPRTHQAPAAAPVPRGG